jgi:cytochrome c-type biogenesis protein CcmH/NrfG
MKEGMDALYSGNDAASAEERFREVLRLNPTHYGATYQLATALDRMNRRGEATHLWKVVLQMAESYADEGTAATARSRLESRPSGST